MTPSISIVTSVHLPDDPRIRYKTARTLVEDGWNVEYVCPDPGPSDASGLRVKRLRGGRMVRSARATMHVLRSGADVVVVNDPELLPAAITRGTLRGRRRSVFDLHEHVPAALRTRRRTPRWLRGPTAAIAGWLIRVAGRVSTVTLAEEGYQALVPGNAPVFPNLPIVDDLPLRDADAHGYVSVGDITDERGAELLVDAVASIGRPVRLTMIGRCPDELRARLGRVAEGRIDLELPGFLPYEEAWNLAARHAVGVSPLLDLPNYRESLPTKVLEYRAVGLAPVVSDLAASLDAIDGSSAARSFRAGDVASLADALQSASEAENLVTALEEAPTVRAGVAWPAREVAAFYRSLVA